MRTFLIVALGVLFSLQVSAVSAQTLYGVPAPTIFESEIVGTVSDAKPLITGVTFNDTVVDVYIDNALVGRAQVANHESGVANFAYKPDSSLDNGEHVIHTVARSLDETVYSINSVSAVVNIFQPVEKVSGITVEVGENNKTRIVGFVPNGYEVQIFIGGREFVKFTPPEAAYGDTTSFWYAPGLPNGNYRVGVVTKDLDGNTSELVEQILTFGSLVDIVVNDQDDKEEIKEVVVEVVEGVTATNPVSVEDLPTLDEMDKILDDLESSDGVMIIDEELDGGKVVIGDVVSEDVITTDDSVEKGDVIVFGDSLENEEEIDGGVSEEVDDDKNRKNGFGLLLVVVLVLAIWYVREKNSAKKDSDSDQISMEELKEKLAGNKTIVIDAEKEKAKIEIKNENNNTRNKKKKKKKKHRR